MERFLEDGLLFAGGGMIHCSLCFTLHILSSIPWFQTGRAAIYMRHCHVGWHPGEAVCAGCKGLGTDPLPQVVPAVWRPRSCECPTAATHALDECVLSTSPCSPSLCMSISSSPPLLSLPQFSHASPSNSVLSSLFWGHASPLIVQLYPPITLTSLST